MRQYNTECQVLLSLFLPLIPELWDQWEGNGHFVFSY